jgi:hypothetical protein
VQDGQDDLELGVVQRLAGLFVHQLGQPAHVPDQVRLPGQQPDAPPGPAEPGPPAGRLAGVRDRRLDLAAAVYREGGQHFSGCGVDCFKHR